jgi:hypothetical protein
MIERSREAVSMETPWKMPPLIKVYEALGAIGDGRVRIVDERVAMVKSSDGSKTYEVQTSRDGREIASNDNASYWKGYVGYPAIAVLIRRGLISAPVTVPDALAGIAWKELNRRFHNDYERTLAEVDSILEQTGHDPDAIRAEAETVLDAIAALRPYRGKRKRPPSELRASR